MFVVADSPRIRSENSHLQQRISLAASFAGHVSIHRLGKTVYDRLLSILLVAVETGQLAPQFPSSLSPVNLPSFLQRFAWLFKKNVRHIGAVGRFAATITWVLLKVTRSCLTRDALNDALFNASHREFTGFQMCNVYLPLPKKPAHIPESLESWS